MEMIDSGGFVHGKSLKLFIVSLLHSNTHTLSTPGVLLGNSVTCKIIVTTM